ncbi:MAG: hypothetical protein C0482_02940 [Gordonia sp.]|uniref:SCO6745 family protein n=1 Tax=Williamsia sp. 1138 TaxID=1903117 RepID=UPI000A111F7E|nr:hypothetical protein [Williamsia sp. 1138]MBA4021296.1 hypothetical protein [Gordonia sp. (in: high G+C Gram-positive bacteria)]OZG27496.1 hypothetical protein BH683_019065 [Williamsia sp. 1138]
MTFKYSGSDRALARAAYETLEPFHVLAYFSPEIKGACADTGLDFHGWYVGARGAPLGPCDASVVAAAFFNFSPAVVTPGWDAAKAVGLDVVDARRYQMLDETLRPILGDRIADPALDELADRYAEKAATLPMGGRPLAAAWAASTPPTQPHVRLWHSIAIIREWRGDAHIAALVIAGLDRLEALVLHESPHPDPTLRRRALGKKLVMITRGWSDDDWDAAVERLVARGLLERTETGEAMTAAGGELYDHIEDLTDDAAAAAWAGDSKSEELLSATKPFVKAVIDSGVLPGTKKK